MFYYCFAVEPTPEHPKFYEVQAGWAHVIFRQEPDDAERWARDYFARHHWDVKAVLDARLIPPERYDKIPTEAQEVLRFHRTCVWIDAYETGGGPELPPAISW